MLGVEQSVKSRTSFGGTAPGNVRREARPVAEAAGEGRTATWRMRARFDNRYDRRWPRAGPACVLQGVAPWRLNDRSMHPCRRGCRACLAAMALAGCGRKGALEAPTARGDRRRRPRLARRQTRAAQEIRTGTFILDPPALDRRNPVNHFAYRDGVLHAEDVPLPDNRGARSARPSTAIRRRRWCATTASSARPSPASTR